MTLSTVKLANKARSPSRCLIAADSEHGEHTVTLERSALNAGICVILAGRCLVVRGCGNAPHNGRRHRRTQRQSPVTTFRHGCYDLNLLDTVYVGFYVI